MGACLSQTTNEITLKFHTAGGTEFQLAPEVSKSRALSGLKTVITGAVYRRFGKEDVARFVDMLLPSVEQVQSEIVGEDVTAAAEVGAARQAAIIQLAEELVKDVPNGRPTFVFAYGTLYLRVDISSQLPVFSRKMASFTVVKKPKVEIVEQHPSRYANPCVAEVKAPKPVDAFIKPPKPVLPPQAPFIMPPPLFTGKTDGVELKAIVITPAASV